MEYEDLLMESESLGSGPRISMRHACKGPGLIPSQGVLPSQVGQRVARGAILPCVAVLLSTFSLRPDTTVLMTVVEAIYWFVVKWWVVPYSSHRLSIPFRVAWERYGRPSHPPVRGNLGLLQGSLRVLYTRSFDQSSYVLGPKVGILYILGTAKKEEYLAACLSIQDPVASEPLTVLGPGNSASRRKALFA